MSTVSVMSFKKLLNCYTCNYRLIDELVDICFVYLTDVWDESLAHKHLKIKNKFIKSTLPNKRITYRNVFSLIEAKSPNKVYWKLKITEMFYSFKTFYNSPVKPNYISIGIIKESEATNEWTYIDQSFSQDQFGFGIYSMTGNKVNNQKNSAYATKFGLNDIIGIYLDLQQYTLSFSINNIHFGTAFDDLPKENYKLAVSMFKRGVEIEMIEYGRICD